MRKHTLRNTIRIALLGASFISAAALAADVDEIEPNQPINQPQQLTSDGGTITVHGVLGSLSGFAVPDVDFFSFYATTADTINIDVYGYKYNGVPYVKTVDTILALFGPAPDYIVLHQFSKIDSNTLDHDQRDARIQNFTPTVAGWYTVGVTYEGRWFGDKGILTRNTYNTKNGVYTLVIAGTSPQVMQINIDIKPGSGTSDAPINPRSKGKIPVALLSSADFNAVMVNVDSLRFGPTGTEAEANSCGTDGEDVNGDGLLDLVCHFDNQSAGFSSDSTEGIVTGETGASGTTSSAMSNKGRRFEGRGYLKVTPALRVY